MTITAPSSTSHHERICRYLAKCEPAISGQGGHDQTFFVACQLVNGFGLDEMEALNYLKLYSETCQPPWTERELLHKVQSAGKASHNKPRGHLLKGEIPKLEYRRPAVLPQPAQPKPAADPATEIENLLGGKILAEADILERSPIRIEGDDAALLVSTLYQQGDKINIVTSYNVSQDGRTSPADSGTTHERDELLRQLKSATPQSKAGAWVRMNPLDGGGVADANVTDHRFMLLESDAVPNDLWASLCLTLPLPVAAIIDSGNKSAHVWLRVNCLSRGEYKEAFETIVRLLKRFGLDSKNSNPGRLSRLPGVTRHIPKPDQRQRLLYLNPAPPALDLAALEQATKTESDQERKIRELFEKRLYLPSEPVVEPVRIYDLNGVTCCTAGNITALFAAEGVGKSAVMGAMMSAAIKPEGATADCLGWTAEPIGDKCIIHLDTEQSKEHRAKSLKRVADRVGLSEVPRNIVSVRLHGLGWAECQLLLGYAIKRALNEFPAIHSIFIDGPGDLVPSVNDEEASNSHVADLMLAAETYGTHIITVIHLNHGTMNDSKMRGHLGSQLARKAETTLKVALKDETRILYAPKTRQKPIPEKAGTCFQWSEEAGMFVTVASLAEREEKERIDSLKSIATKVFSDAGKKMLRASEITSRIRDGWGVSQSTAERRFRQLRDELILRSQVADLYELV